MGERTIDVTGLPDRMITQLQALVIAMRQTWPEVNQGIGPRPAYELPPAEHAAAFRAWAESHEVKASQLSPAERAAEFRAWAESHPKREGGPVEIDDSRESTYDRSCE